MPEMLLKTWSDWSAGIGHPLDDGQTPGMQYAAGLLGLRGGLRAAPFFNVVTPEMTMAQLVDNGVVYAYVGAMLKPVVTTTHISYANAGTSAKNNGASLTFAYDPTLTANGYLVVCVSASGGSAPTGVTFDGVAMTRLAVKNNGTSVTGTIWGLAAPADASKNVIVTHAAGHDVVAGAMAFNNVHQTVSTGDIFEVSGTVGGMPAYVKRNLTPGVGDMGVDCMTGLAITAHYPGVRQTERWDANQGTIEGSGSVQPANSAWGGAFGYSSYHPQYLFEEPATIGLTDDQAVQLYIEMDDNDRWGGSGKVLHKISLENAHFGTSWGEHPLLTSGTKRAGQPARYQGSWWLPAGNNFAPLELSAVHANHVWGDTLDILATMAAGSEHLGILSHQMIGVVEDGTNAGGVRILKEDGTPDTNADWGAVFQVGDKTERPGGVRGLQGLTFVTTREGLFSFSSKGRSRLVFEDFRSWPNTFANLPLNAFKGGLFIIHPSGLQWYVPGDIPVSVGVGFDLEANDIPLPGTAELKGGRYHSTATAGDYVWAIYQPDPSSTTAVVMCAFSASSDPRDLVWQGLGTITLLDADHMSAIGVAVGGRPLSADYVTPTAWFGNGMDFNYIVLNSRAGPFRTRADTHRVMASGEAYFSELIFAEPTDLSSLVVTAADMAVGDEWQISLITEDGKEKNLGWIKSNGRVSLKVDRHSVHRLTLHVTFTGTSTAARVPPAIKLVQLYGEGPTA